MMFWVWGSTNVTDMDNRKRNEIGRDGGMRGRLGGRGGIIDEGPEGKSRLNPQQ